MAIFDNPASAVPGMALRAGVSGASASGMSTFRDIAAGINTGALGFASGFAKDPQRRGQAAAQLAQNQQLEAQQQAQAMEEMRATIAQSFERFKLYSSAIQGIGSERIPSSMRKALESEAQIIDAFEPGQGEHLLNYALGLADMPREGEAPKFQNVVDATGNNIGLVNVNDIDAMAKLPQGARLAGDVSQPLPAYSAERQAQEVAQSRAGASQTNIISPFESQSQKNLADLQAKVLEGMRVDAGKAANVLQGVQRLNQTIADGLETGALQNIAGEVGNYLSQLGVDPSITEGLLNASNSAQFQKAAAELVRGVAGSLGTGFSNADRDFLLTTLPNINDPNQATVATLEYLTQRAQGEISVFDQAYAAAASGEDPVTAYREYVKRIGASTVAPGTLEKPAQPQGNGGGNKRMRFDENGNQIQ